MFLNKNVTIILFDVKNIFLITDFFTFQCTRGVSRYFKLKKKVVAKYIKYLINCRSYRNSLTSPSLLYLIKLLIIKLCCISRSRLLQITLEIYGVRYFMIQMMNEEFF